MSTTITPEVRVLRDLKEHTFNLIWTRPDMPVHEAKLWINLLIMAPSLRIARRYGFKGIRSTRDKWRTVRALQRYVRIFG